MCENNEFLLRQIIVEQSGIIHKYSILIDNFQKEIERLNREKDDLNMRITDNEFKIREIIEQLSPPTNIKNHI